MHKIFIDIYNTAQWYSIIREANAWFGVGNWIGQPRIRKKLERLEEHQKWANHPLGGVMVWFDVPDPQFATWVKLKYALPGNVKTTK